MRKTYMLFFLVLLVCPAQAQQVKEGTYYVDDASVERKEISEVTEKNLTLTTYAYSKKGKLKSYSRVFEKVLNGYERILGKELVYEIYYSDKAPFKAGFFPGNDNATDDKYLIFGENGHIEEITMYSPKTQGGGLLSAGPAYIVSGRYVGYNFHLANSKEKVDSTQKRSTIDTEFIMESAYAISSFSNDAELLSGEDFEQQEAFYLKHFAGYREEELGAFSLKYIIATKSWHYHKNEFDIPLSRIKYAWFISVKTGKNEDEYYYVDRKNIVETYSGNTYEQVPVESESLGKYKIDKFWLDGIK